MFSTRSIIFLLVISVSCFGADKPKLQSSVDGKICKLDGAINKRTKVSVQIEMGEKKELSLEEIEKKGQDPAWRRDYYSGWAPVKRVLIKVNSNAVDIPQSSFQDLYAVSSMEMFERKGSLYLLIGGGDAGESYSATFRIISSARVKGKFRLSERILRHGEFPDEVWEKTIYQNTIWDDPNM